MALDRYIGFKPDSRADSLLAAVYNLNAAIAMTPIATTLVSSAHRFAHDQAPALHRHLQQCEKARGHWFGAAVLAERLHSFVAPRLATTVAVAGLALMLALQCL